MFIIRDDSMKELYESSLQMIKVLGIKNEEEYTGLLKHYMILSLESLKWMARTRNFKKIVKLANAKTNALEYAVQQSNDSIS